MGPEISPPEEICCPRCGAKMGLERIVDAQTMVKLEDGGYVSGGRGSCSCGVTAVLAIKQMPDNPTFTLLFNIYDFSIRDRKDNVPELS